jgi:hypothetical protein
VSEKKALGLGPLIGQTVHKIGHNCMDDLAPRSSDLVLAVAVHTDATTTPLRRRDHGSRQLPESH